MQTSADLTNHTKRLIFVHVDQKILQQPHTRYTKCHSTVSKILTVARGATCDLTRCCSSVRCCACASWTSYSRTLPPLWHALGMMDAEMNEMMCTLAEEVMDVVVNMEESSKRVKRRRASGLSNAQDFPHSSTVSTHCLLTLTQVIDCCSHWNNFFLYVETLIYYQVLLNTYSRRSNV